MKTQKSHLQDIIYIGLFAALIAVCSQIQIPSAVPFTLQTFAVFLCTGLLGGKRGTISVLVYILLGIVGLPVFAGFKGGIGSLLGLTGGYIIGFVFTALIMWGCEKMHALKQDAQRKSSDDTASESQGADIRKKTANMPVALLALSMLLGLIACYAFGTAWFVIVYSNTKEPIGILSALMWCVFPFILPDIIKIALAVLLTQRLKRFVI